MHCPHHALSGKRFPQGLAGWIGTEKRMEQRIRRRRFALHHSRDADFPVLIGRWAYEQETRRPAGKHEYISNGDLRLMKGPMCVDAPPPTWAFLIHLSGVPAHRSLAAVAIEAVSEHCNTARDLDARLDHLEPVDTDVPANLIVPGAQGGQAVEPLRCERVEVGDPSAEISMKPSGSPRPQRSSAVRSIPITISAASGSAVTMPTTLSVRIILCQAHATGHAFPPFWNMPLMARTGSLPAVFRNGLRGILSQPRGHDRVQRFRLSCRLIRTICRLPSAGVIHM